MSALCTIAGWSVSPVVLMSLAASALSPSVRDFMRVAVRIRNYSVREFFLRRIRDYAVGGVKEDPATTLKAGTFE